MDILPDIISAWDIWPRFQMRVAERYGLAHAEWLYPNYRAAERRDYELMRAAQIGKPTLYLIDGINVRRNPVEYDARHLPGEDS